MIPCSIFFIIIFLFVFAFVLPNYIFMSLCFRVTSSYILFLIKYQ